MVNLFSFIKDYLVDQESGIRQLITWFLNLVMEEESLLQSGAQRYERTDSRKASRNGYKPRTLLTKYGELELLKPQFREFPFETQVFEKYSRVEKAILTAVAESYLQGVSTRRVEKVMTALGSVAKNLILNQIFISTEKTIKKQTIFQRTCRFRQLFQITGL